MVQKVPDSMLATPGGATGIIDIAYSTTIFLDATVGKRMARHTVSGAETWVLGAGPLPGGVLQVVLIGNGGSLAVPGDWTLIPGSSAPSLSSGTRNLIAIFYEDNSVLWSVTPMSSLDVVAPTLVSAVVADTDATKIVLTWSEQISAAISASSAFAISAGHTISAHTYVDATHTYLTVTPVFVQGESRTLAYTQPAINLMQDLAGNLLANFSGTAITDSVTTPTLVSATVADSDALRINLVWSESMNSTVSAAAAFAVSAGHTVSAHTYDGATTSHLTITTPFVTGETRTLAYTVPGSNKMQDLAGGNLVAAIASAAITNNVTNPTLVSAVVANSTPTKIDLTWSEAMNASVLTSAANFAVSSGHALTGHVNVDATHSQLTTSTPFVAGETKTLAYTASGTNDMKDTAGGNLVANFSGATITDNVSASGAFLDDFSGTYPTRSDGGSWTLLTGTAPVNSAGKLTHGAAAGCIAADLTYQNATYSVDVTTTVGTFTPIMRIFSDGNATTNYIAIAIDNTGAAFGLMVFQHLGGVFTSLGTTTGAVFTSGVAATVALVVSGAPSAVSLTVKVNGSNVSFTGGVTNPIIGSSNLNNSAAVSGATKAGIEMPASAVSFDNYSAA